MQSVGSPSEIKAG